MNLSVTLNAGKINLGIKWLQKELEENDTISKKGNRNRHNQASTISTPTQKKPEGKLFEITKTLVN